jgi:2-polyprenyl-3-methyl-5-hydroxy-6-metoxy-1,4-benzoquinol methylase
MRNPHFDDDLILWDDKYIGRYKPVDYAVQFDAQWKLFLERKVGFHNHSGVETSDEFINHRIYELTGVNNYLDTIPGTTGYNGGNNVIHSQTLTEKFPINFVEGKKCIDIGAGCGRWTKVLLKLGASEVTSLEVSEHALRSLREINSNVENIDLFEIGEREHLHGKYDFSLLWGVVQHTHNPWLAFKNAATTTKKNGQLYLMAYNETYHSSNFVISARKYYRKLTTFEEKLNFAYELSERKGNGRENAINQLDMLNTFYNWTIKEETIRKWYQENGFINVRRINNGGCAHHFIGTKK